MKRDIAPRQIRHRRASLVRDPLIVFAAVPCRVRVRPAVRRVFEELQPELGRSRMKRQEIATAVGLIPHGPSRGEDDRPRVAISPHAAKGAEVMIERAILLRENDDVLDVLDGASAIFGWYRQGPIDAARGSCSQRTAAQNAKECAAVDCRHGIS